jgi:hypothetical protein
VLTILIRPSLHWRVNAGHNFCAGTLAAIANLANATTPTHWSFSWTGYFDTLAFSNIDVAAAGSFAGTDSNSNDVIDFS